MPTTSHDPSIGWPMWLLSASWWTASGTPRSPPTRSISQVTIVRPATVGAANPGPRSPPTAMPTPAMAAA